MAVDRGAGLTGAHGDEHLVKGFPSSQLSERADAVLGRYGIEISFFTRVADENFKKYRRLQILAICFGAATPILVLTPPPAPPLIPLDWAGFAAQAWKVVQALPAALAAVFTAINSTFNYREDYIRQAYTATALKNEYTAFCARTGERYGIPNLPEDQLLSAFNSAILRIIEAEATDWRTQSSRAQQGKSAEP